MFGWNQTAKLEKKYQKLLQEAYELSQTDRKKSDAKAAEAEKVRQRLEAMEDTN